MGRTYRNTCQVPLSIQCWLKNTMADHLFLLERGKRGVERQIFHVTIPLIVAE